MRAAALKRAGEEIVTLRRLRSVGRCRERVEATTGDDCLHGLTLASCPVTCDKSPNIVVWDT